MGLADMASSLMYRIPILRSTVRIVRQKYSQVKTRNVFVHLLLSSAELCFYLCVRLMSQIQNCDYGRYLGQLNHYAYLWCQYATPVLWSQVLEAWHLAKQLASDASTAFMKTIDHALCGLRGFESPHSTVNFDSPNMVTLIELITRSLAELNIKENRTNSLLDVGGYEHEFHQSGVIVEHSSTSCHCDKHHNHQLYAHNNNNIDTLATIEFQPAANKRDTETMSTASLGSADENIIVEPYGKDDHDDHHVVDNYSQVADNYSHVTDKYSQVADNYNHVADEEHQQVDNAHFQDVEIQTSLTEDETPHQLDQREIPGPMDQRETPGQEWHKLYPSSQPLIPMMTEAKAFELAEALKEKRQDKTGRDAYEVDTVLVLLSQWNVIDDKAKHYAIDRANLLYLAICYGWSYALQKISPSTTAPIVTPPVTNPTSDEHSPLHRHLSNEGKKLRKNNVTRSHSSVYSNDSGKYPHTDSGKFPNDSRHYGFFRPFENNNYYRRSFPPNKYHQQSHYNSGPFYSKVRTHDDR